MHKQISQDTNFVCRQILTLKPIQGHQNRKLNFSDVSWSSRKPPSEDFFKEGLQYDAEPYQEGVAAGNSKFVLCELHHRGRLKDCIRRKPCVISPLPRRALNGVLWPQLQWFRHVLNKYDCTEFCSILIARTQESSRVSCFQRQWGENGALQRSITYAVQKSSRKKVSFGSLRHEPSCSHLLPNTQVASH